ncbi:hypothetical protein BWZ22_04405 [Seonamhaeicola sp. S2-3]|uniref:hypothetical protein n=1 Tax=Seonamhaeicola sp. S2-3 TaxID=1936081 RepID=UPI000972DB30|nr:hypothetical protein [Seonamhaeicola sp. S2-3]APY10527.1 hypothetical protein BWZ22_04405 [Seonamhaeicola sp. S2-3]
MNAKWYFSTLIIALTLLGVCQKQVSVPNQEIVMDFVDANVTSEDVQTAIANVKEQLQEVGAVNIKVLKEKNGTLKISYYSKVNVTNVKKLLSKDNYWLFGYASNNQGEKDSQPSKNKLKDYNLDVYEIKTSQESSSLNGKCVLEIKHDYDRFTKPNLYSPFQKDFVSELNCSIKVAYKINSNIAIALDDTSNKKPEVRAGPLC